MRRAGKTTFLHQVRREFVADHHDIARALYICRSRTNDSSTSRQAISAELSMSTFQGCGTRKQPARCSAASTRFSWSTAGNASCGGCWTMVRWRCSYPGRRPRSCRARSLLPCADARGGFLSTHSRSRKLAATSAPRFPEAEVQSLNASGCTLSERS